MHDCEETRRAICVVAVVGQIDGHDVIRRESAIEIVRRRELRCAQTRLLIEDCRAALAEELAAWDIDPPLHHVKQAHDKCVAWLEGVTE
jgi:hypothetical protein